MGHYFHLFSFITDERQAVFSPNFQEVSAQAWRKGQQSFVVSKLLVWKPQLIFCFSSMTDISAGQPIVLKFWQSVLLMQRYNLCIEHNFVRLIYFLIQSSKL